MSQSHHHSLDISSILDDPQWGSECPVCGDPFSPAKSGVVWHPETLSLDAFSWDRVCQAPAPDALQTWIDHRDHDDRFDAVPVCYVHTVSDTA